MYDWPEVRGATDKLWTQIHNALEYRGISSPEVLDRNQAPETGWLRNAVVRYVSKVGFNSHDHGGWPSDNC